MPYLEQSVKKSLDIQLTGATVPGHLNYLFTKEILGYINRQGLSYQTINDVIGALECCKLEFYARIARPYENGKIKTNGDVYGETE